MDMSEKNYAEKRLLKIFSQKMKSWLGKNIDQKISVCDLMTRNLLIFAVGWALCVGRRPEHELMMQLLSLSLLNV